MFLPGLEPFSWAGWFPVVMATGQALSNFPHPFGFRGYFLYGDTESCSPEVSGFLTDLTGSLPMACHLLGFPSVLL